MQRISSRAAGLILRLAGTLLGAGLALVLVTSVAAAAPAPAPSASASSGNFSLQQVSQRQKTVTVAVPITALSGNSVSVLSSGDTTSNSFSGVVVAPSQTSRQSNVQYSSARAHASNGSGRAKDCGCTKSGDSHARAHSSNSSVQQSDQSQKTYTVAVPVTLLSGNAVSVLSSGNTTSNSFSGVVVAPSQSSSQSNVQSSSAKSMAKSGGDSSHHDARYGHSGSKAHASSHNSSLQQVSQHQKTVTVAVPITALSGNAISVGSTGNTTSKSFSGVVVAPKQSSHQSNVQHSSSHAQAVGSPYGGYCQHGCKSRGGSSAHASSHNSNVQQSKQSQKTVTVAVPVTALSANAVSIGSTGNTTSNSNSGVVVAPHQSSSQSSVQSSAASASSSLSGCGN